MQKIDLVFDKKLMPKTYEAFCKYLEKHQIQTGKNYQKILIKIETGQKESELVTRLAMLRKQGEVYTLIAALDKKYDLLSSIDTRTKISIAFFNEYSPLLSVNIVDLEKQQSQNITLFKYSLKDIESGNKCICESLKLFWFGCQCGFFKRHV
jgi:hypothetical protein